MGKFLYLSIGKEKYKAEAVCSIYSLLSSNPTAQVVVVTDDISYFISSLIGAENRVEYLEVDQEQVSHWTGNGKYVYLAKIEALQYYFQMKQEDVIFIDCDTVIYEDITDNFGRLSKNSFLMNWRCNSIDIMLDQTKESELNRYTSTMRACYEKLQNGFLLDNRQIQVERNWSPCNSGVIGICKQRADILPEVKQLVQYVYETTEYVATEEVMFTYVLEQYGTIGELKHGLIHYNDTKDTRYIAAYLLGILKDSEIKELEKLLGNRSCNIIDSYKVTLQESQNFADYIMFMKQPQQHTTGVSIEVKAYLSEEMLQKRVQENKRLFKRWYRQELSRKNENKYIL